MMKQITQAGIRSWVNNHVCYWIDSLEYSGISENFEAGTGEYVGEYDDYIAEVVDADQWTIYHYYNQQLAIMAPDYHMVNAFETAESVGDFFTSAAVSYLTELLIEAFSETTTRIEDLYMEILDKSEETEIDIQLEHSKVISEAVKKFLEQQPKDREGS